MTLRQKLLMETLSGHFALLRSTYPKKANSTIARKARRCVELCLKQRPLRARAA